MFTCKKRSPVKEVIVSFILNRFDIARLRYRSHSSVDARVSDGSIGPRAGLARPRRPARDGSRNDDGLSHRIDSELVFSHNYE